MKFIATLILYILCLFVLSYFLVDGCEKVKKQGLKSIVDEIWEGSDFTEVAE